MARILVIEDEHSILESIVEVLESEGFEVTGVDNGRAGIEAALDFQPHLILCDIMMPEFSGHDVLMAVRTDSTIATTPFVFLTALATRSAMRRGMELGADDYLTKPFTPDELVAAVHGRLEKHNLVEYIHADDMDRLRANIIYALPHELRTPLTGLVGCAEFLLMDYETIEREQVRNISEIMLRSIYRLEHLIENHLLYAQFELIKNQPETIQNMRAARLEYPSTVIVSAAQQRAVTHKRDDDLYLDVYDSQVAIAEEHMAKMAEELVDNALKFSAAGTPVMVSGWSENNSYRLRISDQGRGMSADEVRQIGAFNQFNRAVYEQQGTGLGLIVSKRLVEIHGGQFDIASQPERGTTIDIALPLA